MTQRKQKKIKRMGKNTPNSLGILFSIFLSISIADSEPINTWVDENGVRHFSSDAKQKMPPTIPLKPPVEAKLPSIDKYDIESRIQNLKETSRKTCLNNGGINCEAGPDKDGTVICADGSRDSEELFESACKEVRLISTLIVPEGRSNKMQMNVPIKVDIRNESSMAAKNVSIRISYPASLTSEERVHLNLEGPKEIPEFGIAQYTYTGKLIDNRIAKRGNVNISCDNCWKPEIKEQKTAPQKTQNSENRF